MEKTFTIMNYFDDPEIDDIGTLSISENNFEDDEYREKHLEFFSILEKNSIYCYFDSDDEDDDPYYHLIGVNNADNSDWIVIPIPVFLKICGMNIYTDDGYISSYELEEYAQLLRWQADERKTLDDLRRFRDLISEASEYGISFKTDEILRENIIALNIKRIKKYALSLSRSDIKKILATGLLEDINLNIYVYNNAMEFAKNIKNSLIECDDDYDRYETVSEFIVKNFDDDQIGYDYEQEEHKKTRIDIRKKYIVFARNYVNGILDMNELYIYIPDTKIKKNKKEKNYGN